MQPATRRFIKEHPELGECLAEFENRISYLENSQPHSSPRGKEPPPSPATDRLSNKERDIIAGLRAQVLHLEKKLNQHLDPLKRKKLKGLAIE